MKTLIANPIYDVCFKYLMEDQVVAKHLLSALLKKDIVEVTMLNREFPNDKDTKIKMYRIDFSARVRNADGALQQVIIEVQKSWAESEILRFRRYLGLQYTKQENMVHPEKASEAEGIPIVSIYILGHTLVDIQEPVIYVRRRYLDYDDQPIIGTDNFIESLTHDSIVVQIPCLPAKTRNRLERLLRFFDQSNKTDKEGHYLGFEIDDNEFISDDGIKAMNHRLTMAAVTQDVRDTMEIEDEIMTSIENRDITIQKQELKLAQNEQQLAQNKEQLAKNKEQLAQNKEQLAQSKEQLAQSKEQLAEKELKITELTHIAIRSLADAGLSKELIASKFSLTIEEVNDALI